jgi:serine/threonine protein kinase
MGEVYRARDTRLARDVAVKVLPESVAADPEALARFEREAKAVAALSHPDILAIFDFGTHEGISYAVMELLEGETLRGKLDTGPIPQKQVERPFDAGGAERDRRLWIAQRSKAQRRAQRSGASPLKRRVRRLP